MSKYEKITIDNMKTIYPEIPIGKAKNIQNKKFGKLLILYRTKNIGKRTMWVAHCDCGNIIVVSSSNLNSLRTQSCGCLQKQKTAEMGQKNKKDLSG